MELSYLPQILMNGVQTSAIYALVTLGLTIIFSVMRVINFAHGVLFSLGGFIAFFASTRVGSDGPQANAIVYFVLAILAAIILLGFLGVGIERIVVRPVSANMLAAFIATMGLGEALQGLMALVFSENDREVPAIFPGIVSIMGAKLSQQRIVVALVALGVTVALMVFFKRARLGLAMRAVAQDKEAAQWCGINFSVVSSIGFGLSSGLAGMAGVLMAPVIAINPFVGGAFLFKGFIIVILAGLGNIPGTIAAAFFLGILESFGSFYLTVEIANLIAFGLIIVLLLLTRGRRVMELSA